MVNLDSESREAKSIIRRAKEEPARKAGGEFADSRINIHARLRVRQADYCGVMFSLNKAIFDAFKVNDAGIPFPQRDARLFRDKA